MAGLNAPAYFNVNSTEKLSRHVWPCQSPRVGRQVHSLVLATNPKSKMANYSYI
jgi:hypothetical protein